MRHLRWSPGATILSTLSVLLLAGCGDESDITHLEPPPPPPPVTFTTLQLRPVAAHLTSVAPGNEVRLRVAALDQGGVGLPGSSAATFSSSAPGVASVSSDGMVTAVAPGAAQITATLTLGGITQTGTMLATVHVADPAAGSPPAVAGIYDLEAPVTDDFDPIWGTEDSTRLTGVLTITQAENSPTLAGTFTDLRAVVQSTSPGPGVSGWISGSVSPNGWMQISLFIDGSQSAHWHGEGVFSSGQITGTYDCCAHLGGTFTAVRRPHPEQPQDVTRLRVVQGAGHANLGVHVGSVAVLSGLDYLTASDYLELPEGSSRATFSLSNGWAGGNVDANLFQGIDNTAIVTGSAAWGAIIVMLPDDNRAPAPGKARIRLFNDYGTLDFYLTAPDAELAGEKPTSTLGGSAASPYLELPEGEYRVRVTELGTRNVVLDSGTLRLRAGQVRSVLRLGDSGYMPPGLLVLADASY
jgi:hypothetical protein